MGTDFATQHALDEEIAAHEAIIQNLRSRRNSHSAACKLPEEILSLIFLIVKSDSVDAGSLNLWRSILGVCRHWRQIILNTPQFWSWICLADPTEVIEMSTKLSRSAPLFIVCPSWSSWDFSIFDLAQTTAEAAGSRIKRLTIDLSHSVDPDFTANVIESMLKEATTLEALRLNFSDVNEGNVHLPVSITSWAAATTSLQVLDLYHVLIPIDTPKFPSLRTLNITYHGNGLNLHRLALSWVIRCLSGSPKLEEVKLATVSATESDALDESLYGPFPITLPHLKSFFILSEYLDDTQLFSYLDIPISAYIGASYSTLRPDSTSPDFTHIQRLFSMYGSRSTPSVDEIFIEIDDSSRVFHIQLRDLASADGAPFLSLSIPLVPSAVQSYVHLCSTLPISQVTNLTFTNAEYTETSSPWASFLPAFTNLRRLGIKYCNPSMVWALYQSSPPSNMFLETFCETEQEFSEGDIPKHKTKQDLDSLCAAAMQDLEDGDASLREVPLTLTLLKARRDMGFPIKKYIIQNCIITSTQVETLRRFAEVEWDGIEDGGEALNGDR